ncbi:hypothetical protein [Haliscomenobacter sp.]|uniref:hypothetical protein n=1 Tax=Haliscomenobacter sp. TaxID=2717303 RepID=UPI003594867E
MLLPFYSNTHVAVPKRPKIIDSQVVFGTPSRDCSGSGICKVYTIHAAKHLNISCEMVPARLAVSDKDLLLSFSEVDCTESLRQKQFRGMHFWVEEAFQLPSWLAQKLNIPAAFIPAGGYLIQRKSGFIWLKLPITFHHY